MTLEERSSSLMQDRTQRLRFSVKIKGETLLFIWMCCSDQICFVDVCFLEQRRNNAEPRQTTTSSIQAQAPTSTSSTETFVFLSSATHNNRSKSKETNLGIITITSHIKSILKQHTSANNNKPLPPPKHNPKKDVTHLLHNIFFLPYPHQKNSHRTFRILLPPSNLTPLHHLPCASLPLQPPPPPRYPRTLP